MATQNFEFQARLGFKILLLFQNRFKKSPYHEVKNKGLVGVSGNACSHCRSDSACTFYREIKFGPLLGMEKRGYWEIISETEPEIPPFVSEKNYLRNCMMPACPCPRKKSKPQTLRRLSAFRQTGRGFANGVCRRLDRQSDLFFCLPHIVRLFQSRPRSGKKRAWYLKSFFFWVAFVRNPFSIEDLPFMNKRSPQHSNRFLAIASLALTLSTWSVSSVPVELRVFGPSKGRSYRRNPLPITSNQWMTRVSTNSNAFTG